MVRSTLAGRCMLTAALAAAAADYPAGPVKLVVPYPPAGSTDALARVVAHG